ncbi:PA2169 family four-helix-bundle protein [Roseomonas sp. KE0001]|uniref:PA2169 family four-helix-bundle protein n=1 Tax=Roseomonas sp. KE0001 TaxID=2479201 RepID=UPI0018DF4EE5|nr:PA2169 family four-helix-bundle protein [Roseomonas sp. KE0001]MBI0435149.1 PA2169 family four-helix-bundle protein [Roseomonas sp. KE0001]
MNDLTAPQRTSSGSSALKTLSAYLHDSHRGYDQGRRLTSDRFLRIEFAELAERREKMAQDLDRLLHLEGGEPRRSGSTLGAAHRVFLDLKGSLFGQGRRRVLREVVRGEAALEDAYDEALEADLPQEARGLLHRQHRQVRATRDRYAAMLDEDEDSTVAAPAVQGHGLIARFNRLTQPLTSNPILSAILVTAASALTARLLTGGRSRRR